LRASQRFNAAGHARAIGSGLKYRRRPSTLRGKTVGFISNGKVGTRGYFAELERMLRDDLGVADVVWRTKSNYSAPAEADIVDEISKWQAVVTGVGD
jgi:hypothetical protein